MCGMCGWCRHISRRRYFGRLGGGINSCVPLMAVESDSYELYRILRLNCRNQVSLSEIKRATLDSCSQPSNVAPSPPSTVTVRPDNSHLEHICLALWIGFKTFLTFEVQRSGQGDRVFRNNRRTSWQRKTVNKVLPQSYSSWSRTVGSAKHTVDVIFNLLILFHNDVVQNCFVFRHYLPWCSN